MYDSGRIIDCAFTLTFNPKYDELLKAHGEPAKDDSPELAAIWPLVSQFLPDESVTLEIYDPAATSLAGRVRLENVGATRAANTLRPQLARSRSVSIGSVGDRTIVFATDYPHPDALGGDVVGEISKPYSANTSK